jgi:hypothetical protein
MRDIYVGKHIEFILNLIKYGVHLRFFKTIVQFFTIFHFLNHYHPMSEFEIIKELFCILKVNKFLKTLDK